MLSIILTLSAVSPADSVTTLAKDRRAMRQLRTFPGIKTCNKTWVLKRTTRRRSVPDGAAGIDRKRRPKHPQELQRLRDDDGPARAAYLVEAISYAEKAAAKLTKGKVAKQWKLLKATRAISEVCPIIDDLIQEAAMAPLSAVKARGLSSALKQGVTARQATCRCMNALRTVSQPLKSKQKFVLRAREQVGMSGCIAQRLEVARATQYVAPKRSRFSKAGRAQRVAENKRLAAPSRQEAAMNVIERNRSEINFRAPLRRASSAATAACSQAHEALHLSFSKGWRFAPGKPMTLEEEASKGTLILRLETGRRGRVKKCGVVVKK